MIVTVILLPLCLFTAHLVLAVLALLLLKVGTLSLQVSELVPVLTIIIIIINRFV